jgi:hypothetical protein
MVRRLMCCLVRYRFLNALLVFWIQHDMNMIVKFAPKGNHLSFCFLASVGCCVFCSRMRSTEVKLTHLFAYADIEEFTFNDPIQRTGAISISLLFETYIFPHQNCLLKFDHARAQPHIRQRQSHRISEIANPVPECLASYMPHCGARRCSAIRKPSC